MLFLIIIIIITYMICKIECTTTIVQLSTISTVAGSGSTVFSGDGGSATNAGIRSPNGIVFDSSNNYYISDTTRVRKITISTGIISTYAGTGSTTYNGDGGIASSASLYSPTGLAIDTSNNIYIADKGNNRIRKVISSTSIISTIAGTGNTATNGEVNAADNIAATSGILYGPAGIAVDSSGNLYIGDFNNHRIRKVTSSTSIISTIAGTGTGGHSGDGGAATSALIRRPYNVNLDASGNIYFGDYNGNNVIRKITVSTGIISTVAGNKIGGSYSGDGGAATSASLNYPADVILDYSGNLYITDYKNNRIRKVDISTGLISTVVGTGASTATSFGDGGAATSAIINGPLFCRFDSSYNLYISESDRNRIRKVTSVTNSPTQIPTEIPTNIPTAIPTETPTFMPSFEPTFAPTAVVDENATALVLASFGSGVWNNPNTAVSGAAVSSDGELYLSDSGTQMIMKYDANAATWVSYISPNNISLNSSLSIFTPKSNRRRLSYSVSSSNVLVTDTNNNRILMCNGTNSCFEYVSPSLGYTPYSAVVSSMDGYVYFRSTSKIVKCTGINVCSNHISTSMTLQGRSVTAGYNIAIDDYGYVFFQDTEARRIVKCKTGSSTANCAQYTSADALYDNVTLGNYSLNTIGVDSFRSWVYISDIDNSRVILCKSATACSAIISSVTYIANVAFTSPSCFTIDSHGAIYVVDMTRVILYLEQGVVITDAPTKVPTFSPTSEPTFAPTKYVYSLYDPLSLGVYGSILALSIFIWLCLLIVMVIFSLSQTNDRSFEASKKLSPAVYIIAFCAMVQLTDYIYWFTVSFKNGFLFIVYGGILFVFPTIPFIYELYHLRASPSMFLVYYPGKVFANSWVGLYGIFYFWLSMDPAGHPLYIVRHRDKITYLNIGFHFQEHESIPKLVYFFLSWFILIILQIVSLFPFYLWCLLLAPYFTSLFITGVFAYQFKFMSFSSVWNLWFKYWVGHAERYEKSVIDNVDTDHLNKSLFMYFIVALGPILGTQFYNYYHATDAEKLQFLYIFPPVVSSVLFLGSCIRYSYWVLYKGTNLGDVPVRLSFGSDAHLDNHKETRNVRLVKNYDRKKLLLKIDHLIENYILEEIDNWGKSVDRVISGHLKAIKSDEKQKIFEHKNKLIGRLRKFKYHVCREDAADEVWRLLMTNCADLQLIHWLQQHEITEPSQLISIDPKLREELIKQIPRGENDTVVKRKIRTLLSMTFIDNNESIDFRSIEKDAGNSTDNAIDVNRTSLKVASSDRNEHMVVDDEVAGNDDAMLDDVQSANSYSVSDKSASVASQLTKFVKGESVQAGSKADPFVDRNSDDEIE